MSTPPLLPPRYGRVTRERRSTYVRCSFPSVETFTSLTKLVACCATYLLIHLVLGLLSVSTVVARMCEPSNGELLITSSAVSSGLNASSVFNCENGSFTAKWVGAVILTESIRIGRGTSVTIVGSYSKSSSNIRSLTTSSDSDGEGSPEAGAIDSAAVAETAFGPIFVVGHGKLILDGIAVRGGNASSSVGSGVTRGGGIYAIGATLTVDWCTFEDNFAEESGGAIRASGSRVIVRDTVFRRCSAGVRAAVDIENAIGAGGGIEVERTAILIDNCLLEDCYAGAKGGAFLQEVGNITVVSSTFHNNSVGSSDVDDAVGEGGALVLVSCQRDFYGTGPCVVNDSSFTVNHAAQSSGSVHVGTSDGPSHVELHDCAIQNSTAGNSSVEGDQGEGGAFGVGKGSTLVLVNTTVRECSAAKKAGAINLSSGDGWDAAGGTVVLRSSTFEGNRAYQDSGGVIYSNKYSKIEVDDGNWFEGNRCKTDGAVFGATLDTRIVINGSTFVENYSYTIGGVLYSKGHVLVAGGQFLRNVAEDRGGVLVSGGEGNFFIQSGTFRENDGGSDGGVVFVTRGSKLVIEGGVFARNVANEGGVLSVEEKTHLEIFNGTFMYNRADFGGFLFKQGVGLTTCEWSTIIGHRARSGGAIYIEGGNLDWQCDIGSSHANIGSAIYAVDDANVTLRGATLYDNGRSRSTAVSMVASTLRTHQVEFQDTTSSTSVTAVEIDVNSTYEAEYTSFSGFAGQTVLFSGGKLTMDSCDFRATSAEVLVQAETSNSTTIRNAVLGDMNFERFIASANESGIAPTADRLTNVDFTCDGGEVDGNMMPPPCSDGSACSVGNVGVYCQCYPGMSGAETCLDSYADRLSLSVVSYPEITYWGHIVAGDLLLKLPYDDNRSNITGASTSNGSNGTGVVWKISALPSDIRTPWTILPSTGLLLPGQSVNLRVANSPSDNFDGTANITFRVDAIDVSTDREFSKWTSVAEVNMSVTFFHCQKGMFWNFVGCKLCTEADMNGDEGLGCSAPGVSTETLPVSPGYWRANLSGTTIRRCFNEDACKGGSNVAETNEYCSHGYEGPYCAVCSAGFGRGAGNECHQCTGSFKGVMYFLLALAALVTLLLMTLLAIYLVGGQGAVRSTRQKTRVKLQTIGRGRGLGHRQGGVENFSMTVGVTARKSDGSQAVKEQREFWGKETVDDSSAGKSCAENERSLSTAVPSYPVKPDNKARGDTGCQASPTAASVSGRAARREGSRSSLLSGGEQLRHGRAPMVGEMANNNTLRVLWGVASALAEEKADLDDDDKPVIVTTDEMSREGEKGTDVVDRINDLWSKLPLSKLKIVVVVWQILSAFTEITQAPLPPTYRKFLSIIGVVTFDVGHIFSAGCIDTKIDFYDKLRLVTMGPAMVLCLVGVTFCVGRRHARRRRRRIRCRKSKQPSHFSRTSGTESSVYLEIPRRSSRFVRMSSQERSCGKRRLDEEGESQDMDSTTHLFTDRKAWDQVHNSTQPPPAAVVRHGSGIGGDGLSLSPPGHDCGKGRTSVGNSEESRLFSRHTTMALVVLYLIYSQVSTVVFQTFACQDLPEIGVSYLRADFRLKCDTPRHRAYKVYACFCVLIYPLGIPAAFCYFLVRQRSKINPHVEKPANAGREDVVREKIEKRQSDETVAPTAFLWGAYYPKRYYYEVCECLRRLMLTGLLVFTLRDCPGQLGVSCIFAFLSLQLFEALKPHVDRVDIQLYRTGCWVIFFSNFLALVIKVGIADANSRSSAIFSVMLILVNVLLFLSIWCNTWASIGVLFSSRHVQEMLLGFELYQGQVIRAPKKMAKAEEHDTDSSEDEQKEFAPAFETACSTETLV